MKKTIFSEALFYLIFMVLIYFTVGNDKIHAYILVAGYIISCVILYISYNYMDRLTGMGYGLVKALPPLAFVSTAMLYQIKNSLYSNAMILILLVVVAYILLRIYYAKKESNVK